MDCRRGLVAVCRERAVRPRAALRRARWTRSEFGPPGGDKLMLVAHKPVQEELKVNEKQAQQIDQRLKKHHEAMEEPRDSEPDDVEKRMAKLAKTNESALAKILTDQQNKRLSQISLQMRDRCAGRCSRGEGAGAHFAAEVADQADRGRREEAAANAVCRARTAGRFRRSARSARPTWPAARGRAPDDEGPPPGGRARAGGPGAGEPGQGPPPHGGRGPGGPRGGPGNGTGATIHSTNWNRSAAQPTKSCWPC